MSFAFTFTFFQFNYVIGKSSSQNVDVKILWGGADYPLDNPTGIMGKANFCV